MPTSFSTMGDSPDDFTTREDSDNATLPGKYRCRVKAVKDHFDEPDKTDHQVLVLEITGSGPGRDLPGLILYERLYWTQDAQARLKSQFIKLGLLFDRGDGRLVNGNGELGIDCAMTHLLLDKEVCGKWEIKRRYDNTGKTIENLKLSYDGLALATHPTVANWDCNKVNSADTPHATNSSGVKF